MIYRAEFANESFEIFSYCDTDVQALQEAWNLECEDGRGHLINLFEVNENYDAIRTIS